jgi:hypothetical protein
VAAEDPDAGFQVQAHARGRGEHQPARRIATSTTVARVRRRIKIDQGGFAEDLEVPAQRLSRLETLSASVAVAPRWVQSSTDRGSICATKM